MVPVYWILHMHKYPTDFNKQRPPFKHGLDEHSSTSGSLFSQYLPVCPDGHKQIYEFFSLMHVDPLLHILFKQLRVTGWVHCGPVQLFWHMHVYLPGMLGKLVQNPALA